MWFESNEGMALAPVTTRVKEMVWVVEGCTRNQNAIGTEWLEKVISTVEVAALEQSIATLADSISVIHNIPVKGGSPSVKPSEFNDFETRSIKLAPVLRTLLCMSKVAPETVAVS